MRSEVPDGASEGFDRLYGLELLELSEELARGRVLVRDALKDPAGVVHSGVYVAIAEALARLGTECGVDPAGKLAVALSIQSNYLRPITEGAIDAQAVRRHRGRTTWVWEIEAADDAGRLCALIRATIAIRVRGSR